MWRYLLVGFIGAVVGAAALVGAVYIFVPDEEATRTGTGQSSALCQDALARRRQAEQTIANPPLTGSGRVNTPALDEARGQLQAAISDASRYCSG